MEGHATRYASNIQGHIIIGILILRTALTFAQNNFDRSSLETAPHFISVNSLFSDDFNAATLDLNKWRLGINTGNQSAVVNNALELRSQNFESGWVITRNPLSAQNTTATVKVTQPNDDGDLGMSPTYNLSSTYGIYNEANWYRFYTYRNNHSGSYLLYVEWRKNGVQSGFDVTGNLVITGAFYLRLRFDNTKIHFEASLDGVNWTNTYNETFALPGYTLNSAFYYELAGYKTWSNGTFIVDDFSITSQSLDTQPPQITAVTAQNITSSSAQITWQTNEPADSQVEYGLTTSYGNTTPLNTSLVISHSVSLSGLSANTLYHYRVKSKDAAGNLATSNDFTFTTSTPDVTPPIISNVAANNITSSAATITWNTNEASDSQVEYGLTTGYGNTTPLNTSLVNSHSVSLSGLSANTLYHYRVKSNDAAGNLATSSDFIFETNSASGVPLYTAFDLVLSTSTTYNNPYLDVSVDGIFTSPTGKVLRLDGFWDNGQTWRVRFAPNEAGQWSYNTQSADPELTTAGTFQAISSSRRGFVRVSSARPYQFEYSDGTPFLLMGDTNWDGMSSGVGFQTRFKPYIDLRASQHFNAYHTIVVHNRYDYGFNEGGTPFVMFDDVTRDYNRLSPGFFQWVDRRVAYADSVGMVSILFFTWAVELQKMTTAQYQQMLLYIVSRYAAYNVFWVLVGDYQAYFYDPPLYRQVGPVVANADPFDHPISIHPASGFSNREFANDSWLSYVMQQLRDAGEFLADSIRTDRIYNKPVVNGEYGYHVPASVHPYHGIPQDANYTRTGGWSIFEAGGYFVAGFHHTFYDPDGHYPYDPGFDLPPTYWDLNDAADLEAARQYSVFSQFFQNQTAWSALQPHPELVLDGQSELLANPGAEYVAYNARGGRIRLQLPAGQYFSLAWFDPIAGALQPSRIFSSTGETVAIMPSNTLDGAALLRSASAPSITPAGNVTNLQNVQLNIQQVRFTWQTPDLADSRIDLQKPDGTHIQFIDNREVTQHDLTIDGLSPSINYTVTIFSRAADGREWKSSPQNLITTAVVMDQWIEAESMPTKTAGFSEPPGWNLNDAGHIATVLNFPQAGQYLFELRCRGEYRSAWPTLSLELDGAALSSFSANSAVYKNFIVNAPVTAGTREVKIAFTNPGNDIQLIVDWLHVQYSDVTPPIISNVAASNITTSSATINWNTNEASDSQVEYGLTTSYGNTTSLNTSLVISHSVGLSGLSANTLYHYRVKSKDAAGNLATSDDFTFTTSAGDITPPIISNVAASNLTTSSATINWNTNEASDSQVEYGLTTSYGNTTSLNTSLVISHSVSLSGLSANTLYHYRVKSKDAAGNLAVSSDFVFQTSSPPTEIIVLNDPLNNGTLGTRTGGQFVSGGGWQVTGVEDMIVFDLGRYVESGSLEIEARNFQPSLQNTMSRHHFLGMFRTPWGNHHPVENQETVWDLHAGFNYDPGVKLLSWTYDHNEVNTTVPDAWNLAQTYQIKLIWGGTLLQYFRDNVLYATHTHSASMQLRYIFLGRDLTVSADLVTNFKNNQYPAIIGPIYSNLIVKENIPIDGQFPQITNLSTSDLYANAARLAWTTDEPAVCYVEYGMTSAYGQRTRVLGPPSQTFSTTLANLSVNQTYHYRLVALDNADNFTSSADQIFTTLPDSIYLFKPGADTYVEQAGLYGTTRDHGNFGWMNLLGGGGRECYLSFNVVGLNNNVTQAALRLYGRQSGNSGGTARVLTASWNENNVTWLTKPNVTGQQLGTINSVQAGQWHEVNVTSTVAGNGTFDFALTGFGTDVISFDSRESTNSQPELIVTTGGGGTPTLTLLAPNGGESWGVGSIQNIIWNSTGAIANVKLEYSINNGTNWTTIIASTTNDGSESWTIPNAVSNQCLLRISDAADGNPVDASDAVFAIISSPPAIVSFTPTSGPVGTQVTISGASFTGATQVKFNGTAATNFTVNSDQQISATVPAGATTGKISVTTAAGTATSANDFTVIMTLTLGPTDDAYVQSTKPAKNFGTASDLRVRKTSTVQFNTFLKFNITGLSGSVSSARLRLYVVDAGSDGGSIYSVSNNYLGTSNPWLETGLKWNNAPAISGAPLASIGAVSVGQTVEVDVTAAVTGNGVYSFGLTNNSSNLVSYSSKEGSTDPQLVIQFSVGPVLVADAADNSVTVAKSAQQNTPRSLPEYFTLHSNYPNPLRAFASNAETRIVYELPERSHVKLALYDLLGREIKILVNEERDIGTHEVGWNGRDANGNSLASGTYIVTIQARGFRSSKKLLLVK